MVISILDLFIDSIMIHLKLNQKLYIYWNNKKSYNDDFRKFRQNFQKASDTDLRILFAEAKKDKELANLLQHFNINENSDGVEGNIRYEFKRNGDLLIRSKCGDLKFGFIYWLNNNLLICLTLIIFISFFESCWYCNSKYGFFLMIIRY